MRVLSNRPGRISTVAGAFVEAPNCVVIYGDMLPTLALFSLIH